MDIHMPINQQKRRGTEQEKEIQKKAKEESSLTEVIDQEKQTDEKSSAEGKAKEERSSAEEEKGNGNQTDEKEKSEKEEGSSTDDLDSDEEERSDELDSDEEERVYLSKYAEIIRASGGFDVGPDDGNPYCYSGIVMPMYLNDYNLKTLTPFARAGIDYYNSKHNTNFEFEGIEKANYKDAWMSTFYYITIRVKESATKELKSLEARVFEHVISLKPPVESVEVQLCRLKVAA